jgi:hypothetical protein
VRRTLSFGYFPVLCPTILRRALLNIPATNIDLSKTGGFWGQIETFWLSGHRRRSASVSHDLDLAVSGCFTVVLQHCRVGVEGRLGSLGGTDAQCDSIGLFRRRHRRQQICDGANAKKPLTVAWYQRHRSL